jgi:prevent-host-death family protein
MTMVMEETVSKSAFKARALEYFRQVERTGRAVVISDRGRPVLKLTRFVAKGDGSLDSLRGTVRRYDRPTEPVGADDWESLR